MTRKQQEFYRLLVNQMVDFNEDFHKEFTIKRIEKIEDDKLKYLLEDITTDKDKISKRKGYLTYSKFVYYADKLLESHLQIDLKSKESKIDELYQKREWLLQSISNEAKSLDDRNKLIDGIKTKTLMFNQNGKNILDECDYYIIEKFGYFNFFDENKNYHIKEEIEQHYKEFLLEKQQIGFSKKPLLN